MPDELQFAVLETEGKEKLQLTVRPWLLKKCLLWYMKNNPLYKHITYSEERMKYYEDNGGVIDTDQLAVMNYDWEPVYQAEDTEDPINEREKQMEKDLGGDIPCPSSMAPLQTQKANVDELLDKVFKNKTKEDFIDPKFSLPKLGPPISEFEPRFYGRTFPHLFPDGNGDLNMVIIAY